MCVKLVENYNTKFMVSKNKTCESSLVSSSASTFLIALADLGGVSGACSPQGSRLFCFDIQNFQDVTVSGIGALLRGQRPPYGKSWIRHCFV